MTSARWSKDTTARTAGARLAASSKRSSAIATAIVSFSSKVGSWKRTISCLQLARISAALSGSSDLLGSRLRIAMSFRTYLRPRAAADSASMPCIRGEVIRVS